MKMATTRRSVAATLGALLCAVGSLACNPERIDENGPPPQTVPIRRLTNA